MENVERILRKMVETYGYAGVLYMLSDLASEDAKYNRYMKSSFLKLAFMFSETATFIDNLVKNQEGEE